ncbi:SLATT domain-containing protein [uncultured Kordia sp.]|uniref:SLATT domain-containing protein n=1 Tax=uncultured Kordia sp. TaxID=507699 RepID=UPI00261FCA18|nr:SLATT domain-containing protein [uncultured Kordia sp.]
MKKELFDLKEKSVHECDEHIAYYKKKAKKHKRWSLLLSKSSIILTVIGILTPLFDNIPIDFFEHDSFIYWGYASLGIAGGFQLYDRVIGNTNSWIRFIKTEIELKKLKQLLLKEWQRLSIQIDFDNISKQDTESFFVLLINFNKEVSKIVQEETKSWADTYLKGLNVLNEKITSLKSQFEEDITTYESQIQKDRKEIEAEKEKAKNEFGFLKVEIKNPLDFDSVEVELLSDEMKPITEKQLLQYGSQDAIFPKLALGTYILIVSGISKNKHIHKKVFIKITNGKISLQSVTLPKHTTDKP